MAAPAPEPVAIDEMWRRITRLVGRLTKERAHCEVRLIIQDGTIQLVRVDRSFRPGQLPPTE